MTFLLILYFGVKNKMWYSKIDTIKVLVTSHCNLNCKHCYQYYDKNKYQLSFDQLCEIVDFAYENKTRILDFGGGEFFSHPFAYQLLDYCFFKKISVNIATNAINLETSFFEKYVNTQLLTIQTSIDGTKSTHEQRRGMGTFDKTMENIKKLHKLGIPLTCSMALDQKNYREAIYVLDIPYFSNYVFLPVAYEGAAKINASNNELSEYEDTICYLMKNSECEEDTFSNQIFPNVLAIKYDGGIYLSPVAADYDLLCMGNVNENSIKTIVENYSQSEEFKKIISIDSMQIEECNGCKISHICNRGCRMRALKFFGNMLKPDPFYCRVMNNDYDKIPISKLFWGEGN